jgi:UDP-N-acetylglucosamine 2-epimerase (non-hydrolysing)
MYQDKKNVHFIEPLGYLDFLSLQSNASLVITDSGGVQEETTYLGIPCLTVRDNTERPITISEGTNILVHADASQITSIALNKINNSLQGHSVPKYWDGCAGERIVNIFRGML